MADRPILFSAPMVRALLAGTKTQTRRIMKPQPIVEANGSWRWEGRYGGFVGAMGTHVEEGFPLSAAAYAPIQPGDRLWVKETWRTVKQHDHLSPRDLHPDWTIQYLTDRPLSDPSDVDDGPTLTGRTRVSIHMCRWMSRLTLHVTDVRVQRLQDISDQDAAAEGVRPWPTEMVEVGFASVNSAVVPARTLYALLWNSINGACSWEANPWVAAYTFTVEHANIDQARTAA